MFTRRNVLRGIGVFLVIVAAVLGIDNIGDGQYLDAAVCFAVAALWGIWIALSASFSFDEPGKKPNPLQYMIPFASALLIVMLQMLR